MMNVTKEEDLQPEFNNIYELKSYIEEHRHINKDKFFDEMFGTEEAKQRKRE